MWQHLKMDKQIKQMCGTCKNAGKIIGYNGRGKKRRMILWCEQLKKEVSEDYLCESYKNEKGISLYDKNKEG